MRHSSPIVAVAVAFSITTLPLAGGGRSVLEEAAPDSREPAVRDLGEELDTLLSRLEACGFAGAALVGSGDEVILEKGYGLADRARERPIVADTVFDVGSVTKQFTATAILLLEQRGELETSESIDAWLQGVPRDKRGITLHHLLTHTSGLPPTVPVGSATTDRRELIRRALKAETTAEPGEEYAYNNVGYMLLAAIVEIVTGERFEDFMRTNLFEPAGMASSSFLHEAGLDATRMAVGYEGEKIHGPADKGWYSWGLRGAGGVISTVGDLHRWVRFLSEGGLLSPAQLEKLWKPYRASYACGWWVRQDHDLGKTIEHGGTTRGFEASLALYPDQDLVVVVLCNDRGTRTPVSFNLTRAAAGLVYDLPPEVRPLSEAALAELAGRYEVEAGGEVVVTVAGRGLRVDPDVEATLALALGATPKALKKDRKLAKRTADILKRLERGDADGLAELISTQFPGWNRRLVSVWRRWTEERGKLERHRVLGKVEATGGRDLLYMALEHERRDVLFGMYFDGVTFTGFELDGGLEENGTYLPVGPSKLVCYEIHRTSAPRHTVVFERDARGTPEGLTLTAQSGSRSRTLVAKRGR